MAREQTHPAFTRIRPAFWLAVVLLASACSSNESSGRAPGVFDASRAQVDISVDSLLKYTHVLSSDAFGGRAPGSRGEERTLVYLTEKYADLGLRPGNPDGTYTQAVDLIGSQLANRPALHLESKNGAMDLPYMDAFMGWTLRQTAHESLAGAELVFAGYGSVAPEYDWDDFKDVDVTGKVIVVLVGDPPLPDTTMFGGRAMTYYGRWTYKYEIAAEKGAAGAIIIHKTGPAGYPWGVVANSWSNEQFDVVRPNEGRDRCVLEGWITSDAADRVFADAGYPLEKAYEDALSKDFRPVPLGIRASVEFETHHRKLRSYNVVARIEGSDPKMKDEHVIYTAHWDHLGIGTPVDNDSIYNGALDNASGVAATLEIARALMKYHDKLKRSVLIINTTGEEAGLLGAQAYVDHPLYSLAKTAASINIDGLNIWGPTKDVVVVGWGFSDLDDDLRRAVESRGRVLRPDTEPEKGYYYRSDHFPFAKAGVPALYADSGMDFVGRPSGWGREMKNRYTTERYHKPQDEIYDQWDLSGAAEDVEAYVRVGLMVASNPAWPRWSETSEFRRIRQESVEERRR